MITLDTLQKKYAYWKYFFELSEIPRPSRHEALACKWVIDYAKKWGYTYKQDDFGNITVWKPANQPQLETLPLVALQGHLDMVCEKDAHIEHDFMKDPITLQISSDEIWVTATGTTLGADNGIAIAYQMALLDPECTAPHGPLEFLFTLDEETGLNGAANLGKGMLTSHYMINIDNSQEGMCCIGCAGGRDYLANIPIMRELVSDEYVPYVLEIAGLTGGHSGSEIYDGRSSAIKLTERILSECRELYDIKVSEIEAGDKRNAIPRQCKVYLFIKESQKNKLQSLLQELQQAIRTELIELDRTLTITLLPTTHKYNLVWTESSLDAITDTLRLCPHGVFQKRSQVSYGSMLSTNLAAVHTFDDHVQFINNSRFANKFGGTHIKRLLDTVFIPRDAKIHSENKYAAWEASDHSPLEKLFCKEYEVHHKKPAYSDTIHGGIECGAIKATLSHSLDAISIGPVVKDLHAPTERLHIESSEHMWQVICNMLAHAQELE